MSNLTTEERSMVPISLQWCRGSVGYYVKCECGWRGPEYDSMSDDYAHLHAEESGKQHIKSIHAGRKGMFTW